MNGLMIALETTTPSTGINWGTINVDPIVSAISDAVPAVLPAVVTIVGIRKAVSFVFGLIRSA